MRICYIWKYRTVQAFANPTIPLCPQVIDRITLEEKEEEVHRTDDGNDRECRVDGPYLVPFTRETKEIYADREFCDGRACYVEQFADEDILSLSVTAQPGSISTTIP